ncbi:hypothetical protein LL947_04605 [Halomonas sp. BLK-85]
MKRQRLLKRKRTPGKPTPADQLQKFGGHFMAFFADAAVCSRGVPAVKWKHSNGWNLAVFFHLVLPAAAEPITMA